MTFDEIKAAIRSLTDPEQQRLALELLQELWPKLAGDDSSLQLIRKLVDEESVRKYREEHLDHI